MKDYYAKLIKYAPESVTFTKREELKRMWTNEEYPCLDTFLDFYECFQNSKNIRRSYFEIFPFEDIRIEGGGLVFARGHQNNYSLGVELRDLIYDNPLVKYQKMTNGRWFNECASLRSFLFNVAGWQILNLMESVAFIKATDAEIKKMINNVIFNFTTDRTVLLGSNFCTFQNNDNNILASYDVLDKRLYFAANNDDVLNDFEEKQHLQLDWL